MSFAPQDPDAAFAALIAEGERLLKARPNCRRTGNDLAAAKLMAKMHASGFEVSMTLVEGCIERMRIAVKTGQYPEHLLRQAEPPTGRIGPAK